MLEALKAQGGHITNAAKLAGINRCTHIEWMQKYPNYREKVEEIEAARLDHAQQTVDIMALDTKGNPALALKAAMFTLEHLGAELGYQKPGMNVQVNTQVNQQNNNEPKISIEQWRGMARKALEARNVQPEA